MAMTCWPMCNAWCECVDGQCQPAQVMINAVRLRTRDGRYLKAVNGGGAGAEATSAGPLLWATFRFLAPTTWPLSSGDPISLAVCDSNWAIAPNWLRVYPTVHVFPGPRRGERLVGHQFGGPDSAVWVTTPFSPGYPAYQGNEPEEWTFTILKAGGGPIASGDEVSLQIDSTYGQTFFLRPSGAQEHALIGGDGVAPFLPDTVFIAEFSEVRDGLGFRPQTVDCQTCGTISGSVTDAASGLPIAGATVEAQGVLEDHPFSATTDANGAYILTDPEGRTCVPAGNVRLWVTAPRHQSKMVDPVVVPAEGGVVVPIRLDCTRVTLKVVDENNQPVLGVFVTLTASDGTLFSGTTDSLDGLIVFDCVAHGAALAWAIGASNTPANVPPQGVTIVIVLMSGCGNIEGTVTDAVTTLPIQDALVKLIGSTGNNDQDQSDANGKYAIVCLVPPGSKNLIASKSGYQTKVEQGVMVPSSGAVIRDIQLQPLAASAASKIEFVLTWGMAPADLDSHLSGPDGHGGRFHVRYSDRMPVDFANLDIDDTTGFGPERVTVTKSASAGAVFVAGDYHYWVHNFIRSSFSGSNATVTVLLDGAQIGRFLVSNAAGNQDDDLWHVVNVQIAGNGMPVVTMVQALRQGDQNTLL